MKGPEWNILNITRCSCWFIPLGLFSAESTMQEQQNNETEIVRPDSKRYYQEQDLKGELIVSRGWRGAIEKLFDGKSGPELVCLVTLLSLLTISYHTNSQSIQLVATFLIALVGVVGMVATKKKNDTTQTK
jgi:hypothetical protein